MSTIKVHPFQWLPIRRGHMLLLGPWKIEVTKSPFGDYTYRVYLYYRNESIEHCALNFTSEPLAFDVRIAALRWAHVVMKTEAETLRSAMARIPPEVCRLNYSIDRCDPYIDVSTTEGALEALTRLYCGTLAVELYCDQDAAAHLLSTGVSEYKTKYGTFRLEARETEAGLVTYWMVHD